MDGMTQPPIPALVATRQEVEAAHVAGQVCRHERDAMTSAKYDAVAFARAYVAAHFPVRRTLRVVRWTSGNLQISATYPTDCYRVTLRDAVTESTIAYTSASEIAFHRYGGMTDATLTALLALKDAPWEEEREEEEAEPWHFIAWAKVAEALDAASSGWRSRTPDAIPDNAVAAIRAMGQRKVVAYQVRSADGDVHTFSCTPGRNLTQRFGDARTMQRDVGGTIHELLLGDAVPGTGV